MLRSRRPVGVCGRTAADLIAILGPLGVLLVLLFVRYQAGTNRFLAFLSIHGDLRKPKSVAKRAPGQHDNSLARTNARREGDLKCGAQELRAAAFAPKICTRMAPG